MAALGIPAEGFSPICDFNKVPWEFMDHQTSESQSLQWVKGRKQRLGVCVGMVFWGGSTWCWQGVAKSKIYFCEIAACCSSACRHSVHFAGLGCRDCARSLCKESVFRKIWKVVNKVCNLCALMEIIQPGGKAHVSSGCLAGCVHCIGRLRPVLGGKWMHSHKTVLVS